jgi:predicted small lipoprotein YifL
MLKQFSRSAISRLAFLLAAAAALSLGTTACGIKGPLVPAPKPGSDGATPSSATEPQTPPPLIKDPAQPERRP